MDTIDPRALEASIREAFADVSYPGDDNLRNSSMGEEPYLLEEEFRGKKRWQGLAPAFIDRAPDGYGSALSFFSHAAFCFYLPAYLVADLRGALMQSDPVFHLCHGLDGASTEVPINPRLYAADYTWGVYARERFAGFTQPQASAIVDYLEWRLQTSTFEVREIEEALLNYWWMRAGRS